MTIPRSQQISLDHTPWYHCTSRCVRRAFLCGQDRFTGQSFEYRKSWLEERFLELSRIFAIDLFAYAVMSNHYHVVLRIDASHADSWSRAEVLERWDRLFSVTGDESPNRIALYRERLASLSWFMRCINEPLARRSNKEDRCKGRFWEGRFSCQALLDESALIRCMTYVDLNPIRAGVAKTPETSEYTSVRARISGRDEGLLGFLDQGGPIPLRRMEYLELVDWSGRQVHRGKRGKLPIHLPPIIERMGYSNRDWRREMKYYGKWYARAVGSLSAIENYCAHLEQKWLKGFGACRN
ncbi:MAG: transposase [Proteobacteria bacterium]|nr:transposase [Pseudomonadota bacterium]